MYQMSSFNPAYKGPDVVATAGIIPKEMDIFYRTESSFLPEGKTFDDLTDEEREEIRSKYRFSPMRPGIYQGISGFGNMIS